MIQNQTWLSRIEMKCWTKSFWKLPHWIVYTRFDAIHIPFDHQRKLERKSEREKNISIFNNVEECLRVSVCAMYTVCKRRKMKTKTNLFQFQVILHSRTFYIAYCMRDNFFFPFIFFSPPSLLCLLLFLYTTVFSFVCMLFHSGFML